MARARQHAAEPGNRVETLPVEAENPRAGIGPERAIRRHVQGMDFGGARQPFGGAHQAKARAVIAVQSAFRSGPDVAGAVLRQGEDAQVLQSIRRPVLAETVLLGEAGDTPRQHQCGARTGSTAETDYRPHYPAYRLESEGL